MTLSRMCIALPAEPLEAVVERANSDNITRSALTIRALAAYLEFISIREPYMPDITEVIRLRTQLEDKDELIKSKKTKRLTLKVSFRHTEHKRASHAT
jgi:hypothetical protein